MPNIGPLEIVIVLVIVLLIFGPKRLPQLGRSLGRGMREFKDSVTGKDTQDDEPDEIEGPTLERDDRRGAEDEATETARRQRRPRPPTRPSAARPSARRGHASSRSSTRTG